MKIEKFEDVIAWQKARLLTKQIYYVFKDCRDFNFCDQIKRASISVMNNIAEGFERQTDKEMAHFLFIAKGSSGEIRSLLYLSQDLNYLDQTTFQQLFDLTQEISRVLSGLIRSLRPSS